MSRETHQHSYSLIKAVTDAELLALVHLRKLGQLTLLRNLIPLKLHQLQLRGAFFDDVLEDRREIPTHQLEVVLDRLSLLLLQRLQQLCDLIFCLLL